MLHSKFDKEEINREKGVIIQEMNMYQDTPMNYIGELFEKLLYGDQPAGRLTIGTKEAVMKADQQEFLNYFNELYLAENAVVCMAGNIDENDSLALQDKYLSEFPQGRAFEKKAVVEEQDKPGIMLNYKKTDQTHLCLGVRGYDMFSDKRHALNLLGVILGGSMSSRLFMEIQEKRGLAYYVRAGADNYTDTGYLVMQAGVKNEKAKEAVKVTLNEFGKIRDKKISEKELNKAKEFIKGKTLIGLESSDEKAMFYTLQEILKKDIEDIKDKFAQIDAVTVDDLQAVAQDIFVNNKLNLAMIGPDKDEEKFSKILKL